MTNTNREASHKGGDGNLLRVALATATVAALRVPASFQIADISVDLETGVISNVALMTIGPAEGHGFDIDATTLDQVASLINAIPDGVESRFTHPDVSADGSMADAIGTKVGRAKNARVVGNSLRGDLHLGSYAAMLPGLGDVRSYLLAIAKEDPALIGMSAVIEFTVDPVVDEFGAVTLRPARVQNVQAVDFVGRPAANPNGLLSVKNSPQVESPKQLKKTKQPASAPAAATLSLKGKKMDEYLKSLLIGAGLNADATDDEAQAFYDGLSADDKSKMDGQCKSKLAEKQAAATTLAAKNMIADTDAEFVKLEAKRASNIRAMASHLKTGDVAIDNALQAASLRAIGEGLTVALARGVLLKAISDHTKPVKDAVSVGDDANVTSLASALPQAILLRAYARAGISDSQFEKHEKINERAQQLRHLSFSGMFKAHLKALGVTGIDDWSPVQCANAMGPRAMRRAFPKFAALAESTSDFSSITADVFNKSLRFMYLDAPRTWNKWAARGTAPDFKNINRVVLSESPDLVKRNEGGEIKYVQLVDSKETYALSEYVAGIKLTRRVIINDDLNAFVQVPRQQANAAARKEDDVAYAVITNNANMADGGALFNATAIATAGGHLNLTSSGTALSISSLQVGKTAMKKQKGLANAARLELEPKFLLVPTSIEETTIQLIGSDKVMPVTGATPNPTGTNNPFYNRYEVIGSTRLDDASPTAWYLAADYRTGQVNTIEVAFLEDEPEPVVRQETDFDSEDVKYAIRHTVAAAALDFRGLYKNNGA